MFMFVYVSVCVCMERDVRLQVNNKINIIYQATLIPS